MISRPPTSLQSRYNWSHSVTETPQFFRHANHPSLLCQQAAVGSARLTLATDEYGQEYLYHVNATESIRFHVTPQKITLDSSWHASYRSRDDGSTDASSPVFMGNAVVFSDNTVVGATTPMHLYVHPLDLPPKVERLTGTPCFKDKRPGVNFFMVLGDPFLRKIVVVCDQFYGRVAAHQLLPDYRLELLWERAYNVSASPAYVADRDLLYLTDYRDGCDHLVVVQGTTGTEVARAQLAARKPTIGTIVPGTADDVYVLSTEVGEKTGYISRITTA